MMPTDLILVRHGEAEHHVQGLTGGWTDRPMTEQGRLQAEAVGHALAHSCPNGPMTFLTSDLRRARQTAEIIAARLMVKPELHAALRELNNGAAKDKTQEEARRIERPVTQPTVDWVPYPGAESWRMMSERVMAFMDAVVARAETPTVLIVSHGNAMVAMVHWWLRLEERYWSSVSFTFECGSITRLSSNQWGERVIDKLNDTAHLGRLTSMASFHQ